MWMVISECKPAPTSTISSTKHRAGFTAATDLTTINSSRVLAIGEIISDSLASAGGLTHFTETFNTTDSASVWEPSIGTNVGIVLQTRGTGYIASDAPDNAVAGGNARGDNAVDLQMDRTNATDVASGIMLRLAAGQGPARSPWGGQITASDDSFNRWRGLFNTASGTFTLGRAITQLQRGGK